jgi:translation elongation factor EF-Ts
MDTKQYLYKALEVSSGDVASALTYLRSVGTKSAMSAANIIASRTNRVGQFEIRSNGFVDAVK